MTIYDIAKKCDVSIATVSRVLNGSDKVSAKTKEKILAVMKEQNYQPNPFARGLGLNSMKMIGVLCEDVSDSFYAKAISLIESHLRKLDWNVILSCTGREHEPKAKYLQFLIEKHVDAIITIGTPFNQTKDITYLKCVANKNPIIMVNSYIKHDNIYSVICNEEAGIEDIVGKLAAKGCQSILYLYDSLTYSGKQKLAGYKKGVVKYNLDANPLLQNKINRSLDDVEKIVKTLIDEEIYFDAIITSEDLLAVGAQRAVRQMERHMPIVGCNNSILSQCATPMLTSLDNQLGTLCKEAVNLLTKLMNNEEVPSKIIFPAKLIQKESFVYL